MAFRRIEEIHVGTNPPGMAFGGYVYDIKISFGFNGSQTACTVNVVNEDGIYNIDRYRDLSTINPIPIWISEYGDPEGSQRFIELPMMHLIEYTIQKTADSKILTLEFVDHSLLLDKIWVGLARRSAQTHNLLMQPTSMNEYFYKQRVMNLPIKCHPCSKYKRMGKHGNIMSVGIREDGQEPELKTHKIPYMAGGGFVSNIHPLMGGALLIGTEEFSNNACAKREVTYNWRDLVYALNKNNIIVDGIHDRGKAHYRAKHCEKSLKDVINSWCQDLGFDWTWDPMFNGLKIVGRDLTLATAVDLTPIQSVVENWSALSSDKSIITNLNESSSLKNTKVQDHVSTYMKPMRVKDYSDVRYKRIFSKNIGLKNVIPADSCGMNRTHDELAISASLAQFNTEARELYNLLLMHDKNVVREGDNTGSDLEPLGLESAYKFTKKESQDLSLLFYNPGNVKPQTKKGEKPTPSFVSDFKAKWQDYDIWIGTYNERLKSDWEGWERSIADFLGKHYTHKKDHEDFVSCLSTADYRLQVTSPEASVVNATNLNDFPFSNIARGAPCVSLDACAAFENSFNLTRGCWGMTVADEAYKGTKPKLDSAGNPVASFRPTNPNNDCCGYVFGIPQGQVLERGKSYQFLQTHASWKRAHSCSSNTFVDCRKSIGGKLRMVTEGGGSVEGWSYDGVPGINGVGTYTVPDEGNENEVVYLLQDSSSNISMGCGTTARASNDNKSWQFRNGKNGHGSVFKDRFLVLKTDPDADQGQEYFYHQRSPQWGITQSQIDEISQDNRKSSVLTSTLIDKQVIKGQLLNHIQARFEAEVTAKGGETGKKWWEVSKPSARTAGLQNLGTVAKRIGESGKDVYILYVPKKEKILRHIKFSPSKRNTKNSRENTYKLNEDDAEVSSCKTICDFTFIDAVCRCWPGEDFDVAPEVNGLLSDRAHSFTMSVYHFGKELDEDGNPVLDEEDKEIWNSGWKSAEMIFPSYHDVASYLTYNITYRQVVREITASAGIITNGGNAMSFNVNRKDISADVDFANTDPTEGQVTKPSEEQGVGGVGAGLPGWKGGGEVVANVVVPTVPGLNPAAMSVVPIETYHMEYLKGGNVVRNTWPSQALDFTVIGGYITPLLPYMSPQFGIESIAISYGSQGLQTAFRFATRYPAPIPDQMIHQKIEPQLNLNVFGRTF